MEDFLAEWQRLLAWERDLQAESRELAERLGLAPPGLAADAAELNLADGPGPAEWRLLLGAGREKAMESRTADGRKGGPMLSKRQTGRPQVRRADRREPELRPENLPARKAGLRPEKPLSEVGNCSSRRPDLLDKLPPLAEAVESEKRPLPLQVKLGRRLQANLDGLPADAAEMAADWAGKEPDEPAAAFSLIWPEEAVAVPGSELKPEPEPVAEGLAEAGALSRERVAAADFEDVARVDNLAAWPEKQSEAAQFGVAEAARAENAESAGNIANGEQGAAAVDVSVLAEAVAELLCEEIEGQLASAAFIGGR